MESETTPASSQAPASDLDERELLAPEMVLEKVTPWLAEWLAGLADAPPPMRDALAASLPRSAQIELDGFGLLTMAGGDPPGARMTGHAEAVIQAAASRPVDIAGNEEYRREVGDARRSLAAKRRQLARKGITPPRGPGEGEAS